MTSMPEAESPAHAVPTAEADAAAEAESPAAAAPQAETPAPVPATPTLQELELAIAALDEVAPKGAVGEVQDAFAEGDHVLAIRHASTLGGYPDWSWTVLLSRGLEGGPTVLEVALLPGEGSLLAPAWVPWADRLADYLAAKEASGAEGADDDDDDFVDDEELESDLEADLEDDFDDDFAIDDEHDLGDDDEADDADDEAAGADR
ncbi:DUF3027 domain-containing protein [Agrococcus sediminis]|uniref:DUF3027 domain-containing protein n=1 Tax=Agrococcus sediminis TaxID=2599924 RepID=A0A5M8QIZ0_9MICO|nr:DUF3027 domain-containing protein [Agrococcus sediminis]KAA6434910.1 DUF3027 domain-containing protein [Agrococcus sediminis]